jgi:putative glutamine amidotransferase
VRRPKIALSASFFHADPARPIFTGKTLLYLEQSMARWVMSGGALPVLVPDPGEPSSGAGEQAIGVEDYAEWLDGLVLTGGSDVWPGTYGEAPLRPEWSGDRVRDEHEKALLAAFVARGKPVLGICRGLQLLNVALGGTLHQDLPTERPSATAHRDAALYDRNAHDIELVDGGWLAGLLGARRGRVNSVRHQAIEVLAPGLSIEARSCEDGVIEAVRREGPGFVAGVQWHPEFRRPGDGTLDDAPLLRAFLDDC